MAAWTSSVEVTYNIPVGFAVGIYIYIVNFTDDYGNSITDSLTFTVGDTTDPVITVSPSDFSVEQGYTGQSISWTATDTNPDTCTLFQGSGQVVAPTAWTSSVEVTYNIPDGFVAGVYIYTINFTDDYGNSITDSLTFTVKEETTSGDDGGGGGGGGGDDSSSEITLLPFIIIGLIVAITTIGSLISYRVIKKKRDFGAKARERELANDEKIDHKVAFIPAPFEAYTGDKPYAFVCYSHDDKKTVFPEINKLHSEGFRMWYDEGITPSSIWEEEIAKRIKNSSCFLAFLSPKSVKSEHVRREISFAIKHHPQQTIPVYLEKTELPSQLEFILSQIQGIMKHELEETQFKNKLYQGVQKYLK